MKEEEMNWHKSAFGERSNCVEVARAADGGVAMRDSARPEDVLVFTVSAWRAFLEDVRDGELDAICRP